MFYSIKRETIIPNAITGSQWPNCIQAFHYCLWYVTRIALPASPIGIPDVFSLALIAPDSVSYSTKAIPFLPGTNLASMNPSKRENTPVSVSWSILSGRSRKNRILFGGRYSSGMTVAAAPVVGLRPAPLVVLAGRTVSAAGAGRLSFFWVSSASWACLRSIVFCAAS